MRVTTPDPTPRAHAVEILRAQLDARVLELAATDAVCASLRGALALLEGQAPPAPPARATRQAPSAPASVERPPRPRAVTVAGAAKAIVDALRQRGSLAPAEVRATAGLTDPTCKRALSALLADGRVYATGATLQRRYHLGPAPKEAV